MRTYLVVAHRTLVGPHVTAWARGKIGEGPCRFHLVVPAEPTGSLTWTEAQSRAAAATRLEEGVAALRELGAEVTGEVGDSHPVAAVLDVLNRGDLHVDEILLSTLPAGASRWLRLDVPRRLRQSVRVPVTHVVDQRARASA